MNITIIGTGNMARGIATRLLAGGHSVSLVGHQLGKAVHLAAQLRETAHNGATVTAASLLEGAFPRAGPKRRLRAVPNGPAASSQAARSSSPRTYGASRPGARKPSVPPLL